MSWEVVFLEVTPGINYPDTGGRCPGRSNLLGRNRVGGEGKCPYDGSAAAKWVCVKGEVGERDYARGTTIRSKVNGVIQACNARVWEVEVDRSAGYHSVAAPTPRAELAAEEELRASLSGIYHRHRVIAV